MRLFERARAEAEMYQNTFQDGSAFPTSNGAGSSSVASSSAPQAVQNSAQNPMVSGRAAPYPSYMTAEEEKRQLYERAKSRGGRISAWRRLHSNRRRLEQRRFSLSRAISKLHRSATAIRTSPVPTPRWRQPLMLRAALKRQPVLQWSPQQRHTLGPQRNQRKGATAPLLRSAERRQPAPLLLVHARANATRSEVPPEVASAVHHATPHQPADTVPTPPKHHPAPVLHPVIPHRGRTAECGGKRENGFTLCKEGGES